LTQPLVISIDAMGGDHGPSELVPGVAQAAQRLGDGIRFLLHGDEKALKIELARCPALSGRTELRHASKVNSSPTDARHPRSRRSSTSARKQ
jgi:glycerol-3-phosphate acyltransferase PlsX